VAYVAVSVDSRISKKNSEMDVGAAVENLLLAAWEDGVGGCWMASVERAGVRKLLQIEEHLTISCVVALGYSGESPKETPVDDSIKYYLAETGTLRVPQRSMDEVLLDIL